MQKNKQLTYKQYAKTLEIINNMCAQYSSAKPLMRYIELSINPNWTDKEFNVIFDRKTFNYLCKQEWLIQSIIDAKKCVIIKTFDELKTNDN